ncbi:hypothetical protein BASA50_008750 [Batrachochytrium salamandrivorans]|uniref:RRM domain-containing protein n=1 Tax=Batrachochytrium salamandrivorans TaxID=1357716 RepID=A0ABQ8F3A6_9FUNG|nr:hypothetical protein BASA62_006543 [Batrachochytrium salamandrivorans]KAH6568460.1 hypothetical protein BASA60_008608 [Batrachochytrium salamandrivorans]KAH6582647.1 hypothetical protein BASA61_008431 [Batrachochytrium salamandrivorans]KAH6591346.1 hypothetical protein BASA50_008750 [Batrachochytrium salamandrivorans]KAH9264045.1 hypothetical protein BASA83_012520 [Batrachochytrium salamandrivorans]
MSSRVEARTLSDSADSISSSSFTRSRRSPLILPLPHRLLQRSQQHQQHQQHQQQHIIHIGLIRCSFFGQHFYLSKYMRTLYIGNLPLGTSIKELLNHVMVGALEDVRMLPDRNCAFLTFLEASAASSLLYAIQSKRLILLSPDIKAGWGRSSASGPTIADTVVHQGASRNVYIGNLNGPRLSEAYLALVFSHFGQLDCIQVLPEHHAAFVHMTSILTAIKAIMFLSCDPEWATCRIYYGRDRCAYPPPYLAYSACPPLHLDSFYGESVGSLNTIGSGIFRTVGMQAVSSSNTTANINSPTILTTTTTNNNNNTNNNNTATEVLGATSIETCHIQQQLIKPDSTPTAEAAATILAAIQANHSTGAYIREDHNQTEEYPNRTVYLGGIRPEVTTKELCDVIRGGILQNIKYIPDKNIAFATFIDAGAAEAFYHRGTHEGISLKSKRLKLGWGKATRLSQSIAYAINHSNASRNVYIGAIDDTITETRLRRDFSTFGEIELINLVAEKTIAFVNFMDIVSAIAAVETMRVHPDYIRHKINFGKDRCGNPPRERSSTSISSDYGHPLPPLPPDPPPALSARSTLLSISPPSSPSSATVLSVRHMHLRHYDPNATAGNVRSHTNADAQMISNSTSMGHLRTPPSQKNEASAAVLRFTPNPMVFEPTAIIAPSCPTRHSAYVRPTLPSCQLAQQSKPGLTNPGDTIHTRSITGGRHVQQQSSRRSCLSAYSCPSASTAHISTRPHFLSASPVYSSPSFVSDAVNGSTSMQSNILLSAMATASTGSHY